MHIPILHVVICCNQPDNFDAFCQLRGNKMVIWLLTVWSLSGWLVPLIIIRLIQVVIRVRRKICNEFSYIHKQCFLLIHSIILKRTQLYPCLLALSSDDCAPHSLTYQPFVSIFLPFPTKSIKIIYYNQYEIMQLAAL